MNNMKKHAIHVFFACRSWNVCEKSTNLNSKRKKIDQPVPWYLNFIKRKLLQVKLMCDDWSSVLFAVWSRRNNVFRHQQVMSSNSHLLDDGMTHADTRTFTRQLAGLVSVCCGRSLYLFRSMDIHLYKVLQK